MTPKFGIDTEKWITVTDNSKVLKEEKTRRLKQFNKVLQGVSVNTYVESVHVDKRLPE
eukprot:gene30855-38672_t